MSDMELPMRIRRSRTPAEHEEAAKIAERLITRVREADIATRTASENMTQLQMKKSESERLSAEFRGQHQHCTVTIEQLHRKLNELEQAHANQTARLESLLQLIFTEDRRGRISDQRSFNEAEEIVRADRRLLHEARLELQKEQTAHATTRAQLEDAMREVARLQETEKW